MDAFKIFKNRKDAGLKLANKLLRYSSENPLVIGIPRGGVEVAYYISSVLKCELSIIISKKIPHPLYPEYGIGAITEKKIVYISDKINLNVIDMKSLIETVKQELIRRVLIFRKTKPFPEIKDRCVIIVDDGIATGVTMIPVIRLCRQLQAKKIIVAVPVTAKYINPDLREADELIVLHQPSSFNSVGNFYDNFNQLEDKDVLFFLNE